jgi:hypothetical protein
MADVPMNSDITESNKPAETKQAASQSFPASAPESAGKALIAKEPRKVMTGRLGKF